MNLSCSLKNRSQSGYKLFYGLFFASFLFIDLCASAQNRPGRSDSLTRRTAQDSTTQIEERLVALALKGPVYEASLHQSKINEYQLRGAKNQWMNLLTISTTYNDQNIKGNTNPNFVYPKYFFGLTIPLGTFLSRTQVKAAEESVVIGEINQEQLRRTIRAEVTGKYRQFRAYDELIANQTELLNDVEVALLQAEDKFRKGTVPFEIYNAAQKSKNDERARLINLQLEQDLIRIDIEKMIGTSLQNVIRS